MPNQTYKKYIQEDEVKQMGKNARYFIAAILLFFVLIIVGCHFVLKDDYVPDNVVEQLLEQQIEKHTGIEIDLSPEGAS